MNIVEAVSTVEDMTEQRKLERLRDEFAMAALTGLIASEHEVWPVIEKADGTCSREKAFSILAFEQADAMLAERARKMTNE